MTRCRPIVAKVASSDICVDVASVASKGFIMRTGL